jgi:HSP20 family protein
MALWNPFYEMEAMRRDIDRMLSDFGFPTDFSLSGAFLPGRLARAYPLVNLSEDADHVYVEALAPGVDPASLNLNVVHNTLTISGEKKETAPDVEGEAFHRAERAAGKFVRAVTLPAEIEADKVSAEYRNGVLMITMPKAEKAKPKQINVQVA